MSIESIRAEIRGIEQEIMVLQSTQTMTVDVMEALDFCYDRKWDLENKIKALQD